VSSCEILDLIRVVTAVGAGSLKGSRRIGGGEGFSGLGRSGLGCACVRSSIHKAETDGLLLLCLWVLARVRY
jgi:hypothetical protein